MNGQFAEEEWKLLLDLVSREFGLVFQDSRRGYLESRLTPRLRALGLDSFAAYYRYLARHPGRGDELRVLAPIVTNMPRAAHKWGAVSHMLSLPEICQLFAPRNDNP
jgi:chemotaxis methyl-accepting protein methylase